MWTKNIYNNDSTNGFKNNSAFYAPNVASYPASLTISFLSNGDYYNPVDNKADPTRRLL